jgi:hypothetical protein
MILNDNLDVFDSSWAGYHHAEMSFLATEVYFVTHMHTYIHTHSDDPITAFFLDMHREQVKYLMLNLVAALVAGVEITWFNLSNKFALVAASVNASPRIM